MSADERTPAVAGPNGFYPSDPRQLEHDVERYLAAASAAPGREPAAPAIAAMVPHAGYRFSGAIAGETYARVEVPPRVVVLCPNHRGRGARRSIWSRGAWQLPGGTIAVDEPLAAAILEHAELTDDRDAHQREHSGEVHLPFLRARCPQVRIVPVCLMHLSLQECFSIGEGLARAIGQLAGDTTAVLIVASSDMSHFIPADAARKLDMMALEHVQQLDPAGLYQVVDRHQISMCGVVPTTVALVAALALGATEAKLVRYGNSGDVLGDYQSVVGYAGVVIR